MQLSRVSLVLLGVSLALASPSGLSEVKLERGGCSMFWYSFNDRCYKYVATHLTWADAELHCVSEGANLVSIYSPEENVFVKTLIQNFDISQGLTWIGLSDIHKERSWMWSDGCPVVFTMWHHVQPDDYQGQENCAEINWNGHKQWNDRYCLDTAPSVCATRKPVC
ncbi:lactose-binding lectin l-2-like [Eucyclogobius newberryi]|uniref:lactose-binding lectin l-2-like n=1 Tax=Eucyclogobius newberryi TaxID=166745 RepID=UPI003B5BAE30